MPVILHFTAGNNLSSEFHYLEKGYRNDIIVEINGRFYPVYFFLEDTLKYEMTDLCFSFPGLIILNEISSDKIIYSIIYLYDLGYFSHFTGYDSIPLNSDFQHSWYEHVGPPFKIEKIDKVLIRQ